MKPALTVQYAGPRFTAPDTAQDVCGLAALRNLGAGLGVG